KSVALPPIPPLKKDDNREDASPAHAATLKVTASGTVYANASARVPCSSQATGTRPKWRRSARRLSVYPAGTATAPPIVSSGGSVSSAATKSLPANVPPALIVSGLVA